MIDPFTHADHVNMYQANTMNVDSTLNTCQLYYIYIWAKLLIFIYGIFLFFFILDQLIIIAPDSFKFGRPTLFEQFLSDIISTLTLIKFHFQIYLTYHMLWYYFLFSRYILLCLHLQLAKFN